MPHDHPSPAKLSHHFWMGPKGWARGAALRPKLTPFLLPASAAPRPFLLVIPGGGYMFLSIGNEGKTVCQWANKAGLHCAILEYRIMRMHPGPLLDARRAVQLVRNNSNVWGVDATKIIVMGFSAGGHLAGHVALSWDAAVGSRVDRKLLAAGDASASHTARPDAAILAYAVMSARNSSVGVVGDEPHTCTAYHCVGRAQKGEERPLRHHGSIEILLGPRIGVEAAEASISLDELVGASGSPLPPPFFVWHTMADELVPVNNTLRLAAALAARGCSIEAHVFEGPLRHGISIAQGRHHRTRAVGRWTSMCLNWLARTLHVDARTTALPSGSGLTSIHAARNGTGDAATVTMWSW